MDKFEQVRLLITTAPNKGNKCRTDVLNRLIPYDVEVRIEEPIKNVLLVYSKLPSVQCYGLVMSAPPACARKVYPVVQVTRAEYREIITSSLAMLQGKGGSVYVECILRSGNLDCRTLQMALGGYLRDKFKIDSKNFNLKLSINVLGEICTISLLRKDQEKVSVKSLS
ncbi:MULTISPECIES: THUMP domain-containing protein [Metallosphaera]|uniref:THUMP domain-containing protein n=1 Tax=Metallosphaera TaxID=41980 RepID=UPI001F06B228|nr:THUMP domain-containing protein [Metallosphaera sedula]MCH1770681.1 THUMP domain-containing protein [Metallosphaera sedula]MCP6728879.1 THUMP domain-containing protein [Metallosphaera sedula]